MPMIDMQTVIARLCVDAQFREAFLKDPDTTLKQFDLTQQECESIKELDMQAIREYASSLVGKRIGIIRKWYRLPFAFLEAKLPRDKVNRIARRFGVDEIRETDEMGGEWVRAEFDRFYAYLRELISTKEINLTGFSDLLEFEAVRFSMGQDPELSSVAAEFSEANQAKELVFTEEFQKSFGPLLGRHTRIRHFNYNVADLVTMLEEEMPVPELEEEPNWILFFKRPHSLQVDASVINLPLKSLFEMCTGEWSTVDVISSIASQYCASSDTPEEELKEDCLAILEQMYSAGAITFTALGDRKNRADQKAS